MLLNIDTKTRLAEKRLAKRLQDFGFDEITGYTFQNYRPSFPRRRASPSDAVTYMAGGARFDGAQ